jgi:hypothetical protein
MISLNSTDSIQAVAGTATAVTSTISGDEINAGVDTFKILDQRQLPTSAASLYTPGGSKNALIKTWLLANTTASSVTVTLYLNGSAAANQIAKIPIPANGEAMYAGEGWRVFDGNGSFQTTVGFTANSIINVNLAQMAAHTYKGNNTGATANATDVTAAQLTADLSVATTSAQGALSANDKKKLDNLWYDVTNYGFVGDGSTDNLSAWSTLLSTVPVGSVIYFPPGTYNTSGEFTINADKHLRIVGAGQYTTTIQSTSTSANIFNITIPAWFNTFSDIGFTSSVVKTGGAAIAITSGSAVGTDVRRCTFTKMFYGIYATGSQSANLSVWDSLNIGTSASALWPVNGRGIKIDGDTVNLVISNSTINLGSGSGAISGSADIEINQSGAVQILGCDLIGGGNTLLLNGSSGGGTSVAAIFCTNTFFDQSGGSTVKITGANIVNRVKFVQCGITGGNVAGANAVEIASTGTGAAGTATAAADGVDFFDCDIYPNGGTGTTNGFLITGAQGVSIVNCRISGWTNGIQVTPAAANGYTKVNFRNNKLGATNNFTTPNTVGILLNAGSFQYGPLTILSNDFSGSTTPLTNNATFAASTQSNISENVGLTDGFSKAVGALATVTTTTETIVLQLPIPANSLKVGTTFRYKMSLKPAAASATTCRVRIGSAGTISDAAVVTMSATASGLNANARFAEGVTAVQAVGAAATHLGTGVEFVQAVVATGTQSAVSGSFNSTNANFVSVSIQNGTSTTTTVYGGTLEVFSP